MEVVKPVKRNILLNPGPATTSDAVKYSQVVPDICPREQEFVDVISEVRKELVRIVHADPEKYAAVLFAGTGTIVQDVCVNSLVAEGKKICIVNNGAYSTRMAEIASCYGIPFVNLLFPTASPPDLKIVEETLERDKDISVVTAVHHETGTGILNPIGKLGRIAHEHGCTFIVDTISSYALLPIDMEKENVDFLMSSSQKGLGAMTGVSWVVGNREEIQKSQCYPRRSFYCNLHMQYDFFERVGQMHFTAPVQTIYSLKQAIREYWEEGEQPRWERLQQCWGTTLKGIEEIGLECVIDRHLQSRLVVAVRAPDDPRFDFFKLHDYCYDRGFTIYPGKMFGMQTFRLCNLGQITSRDIEDFFVVAKEAFTSMGFSLPIEKRPAPDTK